jgi:hypothetical protein
MEVALALFVAVFMLAVGLSFIAFRERYVRAYRAQHEAFFGRKPGKPIDAMLRFSPYLGAAIGLAGAVLAIAALLS